MKNPSKKQPDKFRLENSRTSSVKKQPDKWLVWVIVSLLNCLIVVLLASRFSTFGGSLEVTGSLASRFSTFGGSLEVTKVWLLDSPPSAVHSKWREVQHRLLVCGGIIRIVEMLECWKNGIRNYLVRWWKIQLFGIAQWTSGFGQLDFGIWEFSIGQWSFVNWEFVNLIGQWSFISVRID